MRIRALHAAESAAASRRIAPSTIARYGTASALVVAAAVLQRALWNVLPPSPHLFFFPAVLLIAWRFELGAALFGIALSAVFITGWFTPPYGTMAIADPADALDLAIFVAFSTLMAALFARVRRSERDARMMIEAAPIPKALLSRDGRILDANPALRRVFGYSLAELAETSVRKWIVADDACVLDEQLASPCGETRSFAARFVRKSGEIADVEASLCGVRIGGEERALLQLVDVTRRKRAEAERERALAELEQLRAHWNAVVAHDLRQPIHAIALRSQDLARRATEPREKDDAAAIVRATRRLDAMVEDLLDASTLESGNLRLSLVPLDLVALVRERVRDAEQASPERRFDVVSRAGVLRVLGDRNRLGQILDNLLGNAVKYGTPGVPVTVESGEDDGFAFVAVSNQGAGIAAADVRQLFERYRRAESAVRRGITGTGLGLYIVRELVRAHGGEVTCASVPGGVTTFRFTVPRATGGD